MNWACLSLCVCVCVCVCVNVFTRNVQCVCVCPYGGVLHSGTEEEEGGGLPRPCPGTLTQSYQDESVSGSAWGGTC